MIYKKFVCKACNGNHCEIYTSKSLTCPLEEIEAPTECPWLVRKPEWEELG